MNLWWLVVPSSACNFRQLLKRRCVAIGWAELESIEKYIGKAVKQERLFKGYIQVVGDSVYYGDSSWSTDRSFDQVPDIFARFLQIKKDDLIALIVMGNELTYGRAMVRGIAQVSEDATSSYYYDSEYDHAHCICPDTQWYEWDRVKMGELQMPHDDFRTLVINNEQIDVVQQGLEKLRQQSAEQ